MEMNIYTIYAKKKKKNKYSQTDILIMNINIKVFEFNTLAFKGVFPPVSYSIYGDISSSFFYLIHCTNNFYLFYLTAPIFFIFRSFRLIFKL